MSIEVVQVTTTIDLAPSTLPSKLVADLREWLEEERLTWRLDLVGPFRLRAISTWTVDQLAGGSTQALAFTLSELDRGLTSLDVDRSLATARAEANLISSGQEPEEDDPEEY